MADDVMTVPAGDIDVTLEVCGGVIEVGATDGAEAMYGQLDEDGAEQLIEALQAALRQLRGE